MKIMSEQLQSSFGSPNVAYFGLQAKILGPEAHEKRNSNEFKNEYTHRTSGRRGAKKHTII